MKKSPEDYFSEQDFSSDTAPTQEFTPAEVAFMEKYMGLQTNVILDQLGIGPSSAAQPVDENEDPPPANQEGETDILSSLPTVTLDAEPITEQTVEPETSDDQPQKVDPQAASPDVAQQPNETPATDDHLATTADTQSDDGDDDQLPQASNHDPVIASVAHDGQSETAPSFSALRSEFEQCMEDDNLDDDLKDSPELLMVAFYIGEQEFTLPTVAVQEVIRMLPIAKLPTAPPYVAGVINLRGRITPLVHLRNVLEVNSARRQEDKFIIICRRHGLQIGMIIERVHTMYRVQQQDVDWNIESHLGTNVDFVSGLLKQRNELISIISVDRVIKSILT